MLSASTGDRKNEVWRQRKRCRRGWELMAKEVDDVVLWWKMLLSGRGKRLRFLRVACYGTPTNHKELSR